MRISFLHQLFSSFKNQDLYGRYINLDQLVPHLEKLNESFDVNVEGFSVLKKPIYSVRIGSGPIKVLLWSQMHGNESTTTKALFDVFNVLRESPDKSIKKLLESFSILAIPMLNPDGADSYTRHNANKVDLNRDALDLSQPESKVLRSVFDEFQPDYCFNLHGQRSIFSAGKKSNPAILSFLAPAQDKNYSITSNRKISMDLIGRIHDALKIVIPDQMGIYDDTFNASCVGDTFQALGIPTLLCEAGHFPEDYQRETTRELMFKVLLLGLDIIRSSSDLGAHHKFYFEIPLNEKLFRDIIIRNVLINDIVQDIVIQYEELPKNDLIEFSPKIESIEHEVKLFGHREMDANFKAIEATSELSVGNEIVYVVINNEKFSLLA